MSALDPLPLLNTALILALGGVLAYVLWRLSRRLPLPVPAVPGLSLWHVAPDWQITATSVLATGTGYKTGEPVGRSLWEIIPEESETASQYKAAMRTRELRNFIAEFPGSAGEPVAMRVYVTPAPDGGLDCYGYVVTEIVAERNAARDAARTLALELDLARSQATLAAEANVSVAHARAALPVKEGAE